MNTQVLPGGLLKFSRSEGKNLESHISQKYCQKLSPKLSIIVEGFLLTDPKLTEIWAKYNFHLNGPYFYGICHWTWRLPIFSVVHPWKTPSSEMRRHMDVTLKNECPLDFKKINVFQICAIWWTYF